jgi:two-component system, OmpR family, phosphate regulon sensor histidine kinase PhoR
MNLYPGLVLILGIALIWLGWHYFNLRRQLNQYTQNLRNAAEGELAPQALPEDVPGLEELSNATKNLLSTFNFQLATSDADRARLAAVLDQLTDGVIIANPEGMVQFANPAAEKLFGRELLNRSVSEALRHHQLIHAWQISQDTDEMQVETVELPNRHKFLQLIVIPDRYTPGGSLLLVQDLTRVRKLETVRRDFISNISHELRTPLASLKALTETLQDGALSDPQAAPRFLGLMVTEVDALTQMAQELLDLSRIESGQVELLLKPVTPEKLLISAAERMRLQTERAGLSLRVECQDNLPKVNADEPRIEQVLVNLIHNSVKFTRPGGEITLLAEAGEGVVRCAVKDTGMGIPAEDVPRIFERFYRVDKSRAGGGTGLGLSISRHLVESHGGQIWAESVEGQGSTFYFTLPVA